MHVALASGESLLPGTAEAARGLLERADAVLLPLVPAGDTLLERAARAYLQAWDGRFLHEQNFFAPATRVAARAPLPGPRNADAAETLDAILARGGRIAALRAPGLGVASPLARDLSTWSAHFRDEGAAWGTLAARQPRFRGFLPGFGWPAWTRHNLRQVPRRTIEALQAMRNAAPLPWALHLAREAAWSAGCVQGWRSHRPFYGPAAD